MNQSKRYRWGKSGALTAALALLACGSTKSLGADASAGGKPNPDIQGGKSTPPTDGGVGDAAPAVTGGGMAGVAVLGGAAGAGVPGAGGAGGDGAGGITNPAYGFQVVAGVAPAKFDQQGVDRLQGNVDGSIFIGSAWWRVNVDATASYEFEASAIVWTPTAGALALPMISAGGDLLTASKDRIVFGTGVGDVQQLVRWTPENGAESFELPAMYRVGPLRVASVSPDGTAALLTVAATEAPFEYTPLLWREHATVDKFVRLPFFADYSFSDDGAFVLAQHLGPGARHLYLFNVAAANLQPEEIKQPAGYSDCSTALYGAIKASVLVGSCGDKAGSSVMFRWKVGDAAMSLVPDGPPQPQWMSADGSDVLGSGTPGEHVAENATATGMTWWTAAGSVRISEQGSVVSLSPDKSAAWMGTGSEGVPMRWTRTGGAARLAGAPGAHSTAIGGVSADGSLAFGFSEMPPDPGRANYRYHTLLWDAQGVRDITQELLDAGFDQLGVPSQELGQHLVPERVWPGASIRIQGIDVDKRQTWFATVPAR